MELDFLIRRTEEELMEVSVFRKGYQEDKLVAVTTMDQGQAKEFLRMLIITLDEVSSYALSE